MNALSDIKSLIESGACGAFIIPYGDEYLCEFVSDQFNILKQITGFSGSSGIAIVGRNHSLFFTDGRYIIQARKEIDLQEFEVFLYCDLFDKCGLLLNLLNESQNIYCDMRILSYNWMNRLKTLFSKHQINLSHFPLFHKNARYGASKIVQYNESDDIFDENMAILQKKSNSDYILISDPAAVSWFLGVRVIGMVPYSPILLGYVLVDRVNGKCTVFSDCSDISQTEHLKEKCSFYTSDEFYHYIDNIKKSDVIIEFDSQHLNAYTFNYINDSHVKSNDARSVIDCLKAKKSELQLNNVKKAHLIDGIAKTRWLYWIHQNFAQNTEYSAACKLLEFRKQNEAFIMESFGAISAYGPNAAIIHYRPSEGSDAQIGNQSCYLMDSGAHYVNGTTDVTRVMHFGQPTKEQQYWFTLALKGHIAIASAKFPIGTTGAAIDALARQYLWDAGYNYPHGTGHGVGYVLGVHEGPCSISGGCNVPLNEGMILSNEPGVYFEGNFGIRIESLLSVIKFKPGWLKFDILTVVPIQNKMVDFDMLSKTELLWLENYKNCVVKELSQYLDDNQKNWLQYY